MNLFIWNVQKKPIYRCRKRSLQMCKKKSLHGDCNHEIKRRLLQGKISMTNLGSIFKRRDITLPTKIHLVKAMLFSSSHVWMWELDHKEGWVKELMCSNGGAGRVPWTARRSNQSILKEINPEYSLEGLILKLKLQYLAIWCEEPIHWKRPWCWERLKAGEEGNRGWDGWMASLTQWKWIFTNIRQWWRTGKAGTLQFMGSKKAGHDLVTEQQ